MVANALTPGPKTRLTAFAWLKVSFGQRPVPFWLGYTMSSKAKEMLREVPRHGLGLNGCKFFEAVLSTDL